MIINRSIEMGLVSNNMKYFNPYLQMLSQNLVCLSNYIPLLLFTKKILENVVNQRSIFIVWKTRDIFGKLSGISIDDKCSCMIFWSYFTNSYADTRPCFWTSMKHLTGEDAMFYCRNLISIGYMEWIRSYPADMRICGTYHILHINMT